MKSIYRVAIIGAGRIGSSSDSPDSSEFLTHAHAIADDPRTELVALVDADTSRAEAEAKKWGTKAFTDIDTIWAGVMPDIVIIATPDETHADMLEKVLAKAPKLIVLEKPAVVNDAEAARLRTLHTEIPIIVNFRRRFDPVVVRLAEELHNGAYGRIISASGIYCRGILHNGSHMLDLARYLFGDLLTASGQTSVDDFPEGLPTVGGMATFEHCPELHLICGDGRQYALFELDILTEKKRFHFTDEGFLLTTQDVVPDPTFPGLNMLGPSRAQDTGLKNALPALYVHAAAVLDGNEHARSTLLEALDTHDACMQFAAGIK